MQNDTTSSKSSARSGVRFFHCMPFDQVRYQSFSADAKYSDEYYRPAFRWAESQTGFYPIFLAVGNEEIIKMTDYGAQWERYLGFDYDANGKKKSVLRKKGEFPNKVLFVFDSAAVKDPVFTDYMAWHLVLNTALNGEDVSAKYARMVFKKSWSAARWFLQARRKTVEIQALAQNLDLRRATEVWVRNKTSKKKLESMGFTNVTVRRLSRDAAYNTGGASQAA